MSNTECGLDGKGQHYWAYMGGDNIAIRKCVWCLKTQEIKGEWK